MPSSCLRLRPQCHHRNDPDPAQKRCRSPIAIIKLWLSQLAISAPCLPSEPQKPPDSAYPQIIPAAAAAISGGGQAFTPLALLVQRLSWGGLALAVQQLLVRVLGLATMALAGL